MLFMNQEYPMFIYTKETISIRSHDKQNLIMIGDSRAKAGFIPNVNPLTKSLNLSIGGATPIEGYYILKKYLQTNLPPDKIIISYAPSHIDAHGTYWERTVKFDFLETQEYQEVESNAKQIADSTTIGSSKTYTDYLNPKMYISDFFNGIISLRWVQNKQVLIDNSNSQGHYYFGKEAISSALNDEATRKKFIPSPLIDLYLKKLLALTKANHIKVYYYTMPFNKSSFMASKKIYRDGYTTYLQDLVYKYNVNICNDLGYMSNDNFGDPSHLYKGADKVSHDIFKCVDDGNISVE
jgi:hypothetical protein